MPNDLRLVSNDGADEQPDRLDGSSSGLTPVRQKNTRRTRRADQPIEALRFPKGGVHAVKGQPRDEEQALDDPVRGAERALQAMQQSLDQLRQLGEEEADAPLPFPKFDADDRQPPPAAA